MVRNTGAAFDPESPDRLNRSVVVALLVIGRVVVEPSATRKMMRFGAINYITNTT